MSLNRLLKLVLFALIVAGSFSLLQAQQTNKDILGAMRYRYVGPVGNRVTSVVGIPGQPIEPGCLDQGVQERAHFLYFARR